MMEAFAALQERVRNNERRTDANHDAVATVRGTVANHDTKIAVISADLEDIHDDLKEIKGQLKWLLRGLWASAGTFLLFAVALAGLIGHG